MVWIVLASIWIALIALSRWLYRSHRWQAPWHLDLTALAVLALAVLGFFWRVVAGQNWMPADGGDLVSFLFPTYRYAASTLAQGAWPLWNGHVYGGAPHVGDIQAGFLYPPNLLLFAVKPDFSYAALQGLSMAHLWFAGAGMYLFLAHGRGLRRTAALAGGLAFMFSDAFLTHFGNLNLNAVLSWLPWVFWAHSAALDRLAVPSGPDQRERRGWLGFALRAALPGVLLAVGSLAGHIQATLFIALALAGYTLLWLYTQRTESGGLHVAGRALLTLSIAGAVAILLAGPVLLPALDLAGRTGRTAWTYTEAAGYSLSPAQLVGWLIPGFFGRGPQFHWGAWPRVEVGYLGILPLILAGAGVLLRHREQGRRIWPLVGLALGSFVLALGIYAIPHGWLTLLPGFGQLRAPARFVLLTDFALAGLAALGLDILLRPLSGPAAAVFNRAWRLVGRATAAAWAVAVPLAYLALLLVQDRDPAIVIRISITLIAVITFAGLLAASWLWLTAWRSGWPRANTLGWLAAGLIFLDVASLAAYQDLGTQDPSQSFEQGPIAAYLAAQPGPFRIDSRTQIESLWQPDTALLYGLEDVAGVANPLVLADFERYWNSLGSRSTRLYDLLNVRYVIAKKNVELDWGKFALAFDGDPDLNVYENRQALPRAFIVRDIVFQPSPDAALQAVTAAGFDPTVSARRAGPGCSCGWPGTVTDLLVRPTVRHSVRTRTGMRWCSSARCGTRAGRCGSTMGQRAWPLARHGAPTTCFGSVRARRHSGAPLRPHLAAGLAACRRTTALIDCGCGDDISEETWPLMLRYTAARLTSHVLNADCRAERLLAAQCPHCEQLNPSGPAGEELRRQGAGGQGERGGGDRPGPPVRHLALSRAGVLRQCQGGGAAQGLRRRRPGGLARSPGGRGPRPATPRGRARPRRARRQRRPGDAGARMPVHPVRRPAASQSRWSSRANFEQTIRTSSVPVWWTSGPSGVGRAR